MSESTLKTARIISLIAATLISLASGTNYVYSAWGPQFAERLKLSSTQSNLIGTFGNIGMYASGIPVGLLVDSNGPRWGVGLGAIMLAAGYYPIMMAYDAGAGSYSVAALCLFSLFTGIGSCAAFNAALKTSALNYPEHRGTATAFPLSAFGLSAFFFSIISKFAFPDDTSKFLLMLATGTFLLVFVSFFCLRVVPRSSAYTSLPTHEPGISDSQGLQRTASSDSKQRLPSDPTGAPKYSIQNPSISSSSRRELKEPNKIATIDEGQPEIRDVDTDETSSLISTQDVASRDIDKNSDEIRGSLYADIRGFAVLKKVEFWQQFLIMGLLTGVGLMTINNIGNDAQALWRHYDDSATDNFIQGRQLIHVSLLSLCSFVGRLFSGIGSDVLVKKLHASRLWCIFISSVIFCAAQLLAMNIENPHYLFAVSGVTGLAYGFLFGCFPSIVANTFGVNVMSQNWGAMTLAPVISGNIFNLLYGAIYDAHSIVSPHGHRECLEGLNCYKSAYIITFFGGVAGIGVALWSIWTDKHVSSEAQGKKGFAHEREA